jgi:hypothetical protein
MKTAITTFTLLFINSSFAFEIDKRESKPEINTELESGKKDDNRIFKLTKDITFNAPLEKVLNAILIYDEKCNAEFVEKRVLTDKSKTCKYHNKNLIETKIHTLMDNKFEKFFVLERRIYNRDLYSNVDMVKVKKNKNGSIEVSQRMLTDKEAKRYIKDPIKQVSVFQKTSAKYILTAQKDKTTKVNYTYNMVTDHWILNKSMATSRVFKSMLKGTKLLFKSIRNEISPIQKAVAAVH